jgi:hypothetical protein
MILTLFSSQDAQSAINDLTGMDDGPQKNCLMVLGWLFPKEGVLGELFQQIMEKI